MRLSQQLPLAVFIAWITYLGVKDIDWAMPWRPVKVFACIVGNEDIYDCDEYEFENRGKT